MNNRDYKTIFYPLTRINPYAGIKINNQLVHEFPITSNAADVENLFRGLIRGCNMPATVDPTQLAYSFLSKYRGYYLPVNPRFTVSRYRDFLTYDTDGLKIEEYLTGIDGRTTKVKSRIAAAPVLPPEYNLNNVVYYSDVLQFFDFMAGEINRALKRANTISELYLNVPTVNEQLTDETVITPNLSTDVNEKFNPVEAPSSRDRLITKTTQTGQQTTTMKRATGKTAKEQADIIRDLPNIFTKALDNIGSYLIDPRTIHDMYDFGELRGYVVEEG